MLSKVKLALRLTVDNYDDELTDLIAAAAADIALCGAVFSSPITDPLIIRAVVTYCKIYFGKPDDFERLKMAYDEQKAQLQMAYRG